MKKLLLIALCLLSLANVKAQDARNNTIKVNPLSLFLATGSVFYERKINESTSLQLGVAYTGVKLSDVKFEGVAITPEVRFYFNQKALSGFYAAPFLRYQNFTVSDENSKGTLSTFGGGALIGRQWVFGSGFALDLFIGPSYNGGDVKVKEGDEIDTSASLAGFGVRTGIALGFGF
jgi:hypothetical protein